MRYALIEYEQLISGLLALTRKNIKYPIAAIISKLSQDMSTIVSSKLEDNYIDVAFDERINEA